MPSRTELIPCLSCGKPRPIQVRRPIDQKKAQTRPCLSCANGIRRQVTIVKVPCKQCGTPRDLLIRRDSEITTALDRLCRSCAATAHTDIDEIAVERLVIGQPVKATPAERRQAVAYLTRRKLSNRAIAERIGCTKRTVERHRARLAS